MTTERNGTVEKEEDNNGQSSSDIDFSTKPKMASASQRDTIRYFLPPLQITQTNLDALCTTIETITNGSCIVTRDHNQQIELKTSGVEPRDPEEDSIQLSLLLLPHLATLTTTGVPLSPSQEKLLETALKPCHQKRSFFTHDDGSFLLLAFCLLPITFLYKSLPLWAVLAVAGGWVLGQVWVVRNQAYRHTILPPVTNLPAK